MFTYIFRSISAVIAFMYTFLSIGLALIPRQSSAVYDPIWDIPKESQQTVVHILQSRAEISLSLQQAVDLYSKKSGQNVKFSVQTIADASDYNSTLRAKLLSGEDAELFQISGARELMELKPYILNLSPRLDWLENAADGSLDAVTQGTEIYGAPYSLEASGLICNRDIFEAAGIELSDIASFDDLSGTFAELSEKITSGNLSDDFPGLECVSEFPAGDKSFLCGQFADIATSGSFGSPLEAALSPAVAFPAAEPVEEFVKLMARFSGSRSDWTRLNTVSQNLMVQRFAAQRVAVIPGDTNVYERVNELNPGLMGRLQLVPIPLDTYEQPVVYVGVPVYWAVNSTADDEAQKAACGFLTWLYRSEEGTAVFANEFGAVSPFRDTAQDTNVSLHHQMLRYIDAKQALPQLHNDLPDAWLSNAFAPEVQSYFAKRDVEWDSIIKKCIMEWNVEE